MGRYQRGRRDAAFQTDRDCARVTSVHAPSQICPGQPAASLVSEYLRQVSIIFLHQRCNPEQAQSGHAGCKEAGAINTALSPHKSPCCGSSLRRRFRQCFPFTAEIYPRFTRELTGKQRCTAKLSNLIDAFLLLFCWLACKASRLHQP